MAAMTSKFRATTSAPSEFLMNIKKIAEEEELPKVDAELFTHAGDREKEKHSNKEDTAENGSRSSDFTTTACSMKDVKAMSVEIVAVDDTGSSNANSENSYLNLQRKKHVIELGVTADEELKLPQQVSEEVFGEDFEKSTNRTGLKKVGSEAKVQGLHYENFEIHSFLHESFQIKKKDFEGNRVPRVPRTSSRCCHAFVRFRTKISRLLMSYPCPLGFGRHCKLGTSLPAAALIFNSVHLHKKDLRKTFAFNNSEQGVEAIRVPRDPQTSDKYAHVSVHFGTKDSHWYLTYFCPLGADLDVGRCRKFGAFYAASKSISCHAHSHGNATASRRNPSKTESLLPGEGTRAAHFLVGIPEKGGLGRHDSRRTAHLVVIQREIQLWRVLPIWCASKQQLILVGD